MRLSHTLTSLALASFGLAQSNVTCHDGLYVVVVRASYEAPGFGLLGPVKDNILSRVPNSAAYSVPYPATIFDPAYLVSQPEGVGNLTQVLTQYGDTCPGRKVALMGYSQGAHVIGDVLIGTNYPPGWNLANRTAIDAKYRDTVVAVILMGDPAKTIGEPFLVGNSTRNGSFPRANDANWEAEGLANRVQSYCTAEDTFCDVGATNNSLAIHLSYVNQYGTDAADFVVSKALGNSTGGNGTSTTSTTSTTITSTASTTSTGTATTTSRASTTTTGGSGAATSSPPPNSALSLNHSLTYYLIGAVIQCVLAFALVY